MYLIILMLMPFDAHDIKVRKHRVCLKKGSSLIQDVQCHSPQKILVIVGGGRRRRRVALLPDRLAALGHPRRTLQYAGKKEHR